MLSTQTIYVSVCVSDSIYILISKLNWFAVVNDVADVVIHFVLSLLLFCQYLFALKNQTQFVCLCCHLSAVRFHDGAINYIYTHAQNFFQIDNK